MDPITALLRPASKEDELRALADSLRKRKRAADFYSISTIKPLQQMGQAQGEQVMETAQRQGVLREALAQRQATAEQNAAEAAARAREGELNRQNDLDVANVRALPRATASAGKITNIGRYIDPDGNSMMVGYMNGVPINLATQQQLLPEEFEVLEPQNALSETAMANNLTKLGDRTKGLSSVVSSVKALDELLEPYDKKGATVDDVPGMSYLEKNPNMIGSISRAGADLFRDDGAESGTIFSAAQAIMNMIGVNRAGLAQTVTEIERIQKELGKDPLSNPQVFVEHYPVLKKLIADDLANIRATTPEKVLREYRKNLLPDEPDITKVQFKDIKLDGVVKEDEDENDGWSIEAID